MWCNLGGFHPHAPRGRSNVWDVEATIRIYKTFQLLEQFAEPVVILGISEKVYSFSNWAAIDPVLTADATATGDVKC